MSGNARVWEGRAAVGVVLLLQAAHMQDAAMPSNAMGDSERASELELERGGWAVMAGRSGVGRACIHMM